jgi:serine/threonine protein kinase
MLQVAKAMPYLHQKRTTHRDLNCANVLFNPAQIPEMATAGMWRSKWQILEYQR